MRHAAGQHPSGVTMAQQTAAVAALVPVATIDSAPAEMPRPLKIANASVHPPPLAEAVVATLWQGLHVVLPMALPSVASLKACRRWWNLLDASASHVSIWMPCSVLPYEAMLPGESQATGISSELAPRTLQPMQPLL